MTRKPNNTPRTMINACRTEVKWWNNMCTYNVYIQFNYVMGQKHFWCFRKVSAITKKQPAKHGASMMNEQPNYRYGCGKKTKWKAKKQLHKSQIRWKVNTNFALEMCVCVWKFGVKNWISLYPVIIIFCR